MSQNYDDIWAAPMKWLQINPEQIAHIGEPRLQFVTQRIIDLARSEVSSQRMMELQMLASKATNDNNKRIISVIVTLVGAWTYGSGIKIFAASLGQFAIPAIAIGGLLASFGVHVLATMSLTNYLRSIYAKKTLSKLWNQKELDRENKGVRFSDFLNTYWDSKLQLLREIEEVGDGKELPVNAIGGILLSIIEYVCSFAMIDQIAVISEIPFPIKLIAATLPVVITWVASLIQSQKFEIPDEYANLWSQYKVEFDKIYPSENLDEEAINNWYEERLFDDNRTNSGLQIILSNNDNQQHLTPELAELHFDIEYYQARAEQYQEDKEEDIQEHKRYYEREIEKLLKTQASEAFRPQSGIGNIERQMKENQWLQEQQKRFTEERQKREDKLAQDLVKIMEGWEKRIEKCKTIVDNSKLAYQRELEAWNQRNSSVAQNKP
jgi:hypothetical protein